MYIVLYILQYSAMYILSLMMVVGNKAFIT